MKHHCSEGSLILHIVDRPEPGVVRPQEVDVVRQHAEVQWDRLQQDEREIIYVKLGLNVSAREIPEIIYPFIFH